MALGHTRGVNASVIGFIMRTILTQLTTIKKLLNPMLLVVLALAYIFLQMQPVYGQGLSPEQIRLFNLGIDYYDIDQCKAAANSVQTPLAPGDIFVIGDSLGEGLIKNPGTLRTELPESSGWSIKGDVLQGRTLSKGIEVVKSLPQDLTDADYVLVVLGSNLDSAKGNPEGIKEMVSNIKTGAPIFWLNTNLQKGSLIDANEDAKGEEFNTHLSQASGITVINNTVVPGSDGVHPDYTKLAPVVASGIKSGTTGGRAGTSPSQDSTGCAPCTTTASVPIDGENPKIMFQHLLNIGLAPHQAAGVVGNAMAESGPNIDPTIVSPSGYRGIFQWDKSHRWPRLVEWAKGEGLDPLTLDAQLRFSIVEAEQRGDIEGLKQQQDYQHATWYWGRFYEVAVIGGSTSKTPLTNVQHLDKRTAYALSALNQYGSLQGEASSAETCNGGGSGSMVGDLAWPVDVKYWNENPNWFTKPHHDYPASDIPVATGTPVYSMTSGTARKSGGACGAGVSVDMPGGITFNYCHGIPGSEKITNGQQVKAGQQIFTSDNTGNSSGPHLHIGISINGTKHCPQDLFRQLGEGKTNINLSTLPTRGCSN